MNTTKGKFSLLSTLFIGVVLTIFFTSMNAFAAGKESPRPADSSSVINFYNPAGSFNYQRDENIHASDREMKAGLLYDLENNKIVWQKEMNSPFPVASLTKMMVALLTVEDIRAGKINWTDQVSWTRQIVIGKRKKKNIVSENVSYSLLDIFKAAMIASNNEAAEQLARYASGDVESFVDRMNTRARELGMNSTFYGNPTGLPSTAKVFDNSSTPTDLLILALEMLQYDEIIRVTGMGYADISNGKNTSVIRNHNRLTIDFKGEVDGMKTGYTKRAGFCLVATSNKCEHRLISIVLGARSPNLRNEVVKDMINEYYCSIGLDKLGPNCGAPPDITASNSASGDFVYQAKTVNSTHVVKRGENLASIAYMFNCTPGEIKKWNNLRSGKIGPGKKLTIVSTITEKVPVAKSDEESEGTEQLNTPDESSLKPSDTTGAVAMIASVQPQKAKTTPSVQPKSKYIIYVVQPGDTLLSIAKRYDVASVSHLKAVNKISGGRLLKPGTRLKVPVNS